MAIQLLIGLIDEHHAVTGQAKRAPAIFVHPTAHTERGRCQAIGRSITPLPDPARGILRAVFVPEQTMGADLQFGKIDARRDGVGGAERFSFWR